MTASFLQRVSLTGADDRTALDELLGLTAKHPFVEWAVLYTPRSLGAPRNPGQTWREAFFAELAPQSAVHLCGALAFEQLLSDELPLDVLKAPRMQLNINARRKDFDDEQVLAVYRKALDVSESIILQYHSDSATLIEAFLASLADADRPRVHVLVDASRGTGTVPDAWPWPASLENAYLGFAGGLGPSNSKTVAQVLQQFNRPFWIDMESGIRTENQFDIEKVKAVLEACQPLVG